MNNSLFLDRRELRNFKLRYNLQKFSNLFKSTNKIVSCFVVDSLYPDERIALKEQFLSSNLKFTLISKKINNIFFNFSEKNAVLNLLKGQVFLVESTKKDFFVKENLNFLFSNKFSLRFVISQRKIYRKKRIFDLMSNLSTSNQSMSFLLQILNFSCLQLIRLLQKNLI